MDLFQELIEVIVDKAPQELDSNNLNMDTDLIDDHGFNSIDLIMLLLEIESKWSIDFSDEDADMNEMTHLKKLYGVISNLISNKDEGNVY